MKTVKTIQLLLLLSLFPGFNQAQVLLSRGVRTVENQADSAGKVHALIVGISDYQNPAIPDLKFADKDAVAFAKYLISPNGIGLDSQNVQLLVNSHASAGKVIMAMYALLDEAREGDLVIFYFSGHGDLETKSISQPGFLLCWDAPPAVYMSGGTFGIIYLQEIITTLSVQNKAKVLMITDACRSGKLAGNTIGGSQLTATNLSKQFSNEMKILSCQPDELSLEGTAWGGGRGVFSYYLLKGLQGLADKNKDHKISLFEIERYLEDEVSNAVAPQKQMPMTVGNKSTTLAHIRNNEIQDESTSSNQTTVFTQSNGIPNDIKNPNTVKLLKQFFSAIQEKRMIYPKDNSAWDFLIKLEKEPESIAYLNQWKYQLAAAMVDETQQAINDYLRSDPVELRKRWSFNEKYERYPEYLEKASSLVGNEHKMFSGLQSKKHYYEGLKLRLKGERLKNNILYESARKQQLRCIELDPDAAFAYNELGLLERRRNQSDQAIRYLQKALAISPEWALAWANLSACFNDENKYDSAIISGRYAVSIDSLFPLAHYNLGLSYQLAEKYELAAKYLNKATELDTTFANAFFNLSLVYYFAENFPWAKQAIQAYLKLVPQDPDALINLGEIELKLGNPKAALNHYHEVLKTHPEYPAALQSLGEYYRNENEFVKSDLYLNKISEKTAIIYFYLGSNAALQNRDEKAIEYFKQSFEKGYNNTTAMRSDKGFEKMIQLESFRKLVVVYFPNKKFW
ncbi:MAG: tetratricopeptide repeat protein [Saprospiraceae bacterium]|nr:tetratricopeptide repeat protein [Saprospiraceae bacterium]